MTLDFAKAEAERRTKALGNPHYVYQLMGLDAHIITDRVLSPTGHTLVATFAPPEPAKPAKPEDCFVTIHPDDAKLSPFWINEAQFNALNRKFLQNPDGSPNFISFRRRARSGFGGDYIMIHWCNMWLGIEKDGYTHS
jgi:hypothetical protein